jgi:excisionase family DNA binding protein
MSEQSLTPDEAARILKVSPQTLRRWLRKGVLKGIKVGDGKLWRINQSTIDQYLETSSDSNDK